LARKVFVPPAVWGAPKNREGMRRLDPCWAEEAERARLGRGRSGLRERDQGTGWKSTPKPLQTLLGKR
jgi:hypothetical protein